MNTLVRRKPNSPLFGGEFAGISECSVPEAGIAELKKWRFNVVLSASDLRA
jgi:hypothetical protein